MKYIGFFLALTISLVLGIVLSIQIGQAPPFGKLMDPNHGFWQNCYSEDLRFSEEIYLENLKGEVRVDYDEFLIPHVFAENDEDLYRVQGYVTAKHRLWQMEFQTMAAAGRISEIVGPLAIELDRMTRRKGMPGSAENALAYIQREHPDTYQLISAYADGVNQYIDGLKQADLPIEYKILNYKPEHWSPYKSLLLLKYMADMLVGDRDLEYTNIRSIIGDDLLAKLFPDFPIDNDPVIEKDRIWDFDPIEVVKPDDLKYPIDGIIPDVLPHPEEGTGSNNWAVSGNKTKNGHPILANDPHLSMNLPSLWYSMQLTTPEHSVKGATLPGALGIISGFNENIAWGVTNATRDTRDWYKIEFKDTSRSEYLYNDQWIQSTFRIEEIKVKGQTAYLDTVVYTHHGPVVYDRSFRSDRQDVNFALRWTAHMESNEQKTFLLLNKAKDHQDYLNALDFYTSPAQNFVFASKEGDIAMKVQGRFPLKWEGQGKFLMDGNNPGFEWQGFIPNEQNPSTLNPERGFVSSANQHSVDPSYPYYIFDDSFEHYRNRRLNERLSEMQLVTVEDMKGLQYDNYHLHAAEALPIMIEYLREEELPNNEKAIEYLDKLSNWNFNTYPNQEEPALFQVWWKHFYESVWNKWKKEGIPVALPNKYQTTLLLKNEPSSILFDDLSSTSITETGYDLVNRSFLKMVEEIIEWEQEHDGDYSWATFKNTSILHLVPNFKSFGRTNIYTGGGAGILNATGPRHGASWRMVVELADEPIAYGIYPGGQSGNPGSKFYDNFIKIWANGEYVGFNLRKNEVKENILFSTKFMN